MPSRRACELGDGAACQLVDELGPVAPRVGTKSFTLSFAIASASSGKDVATGEGVMVAFDYFTQRSIPILPPLREAIERIEGRVGA